MNTTITITEQQLTEKRNKEMYAFHLDLLNCLLSSFCHTGNKEYWAEAEKEEKIVREYAQYNF